MTLSILGLITNLVGAIFLAFSFKATEQVGTHTDSKSQTTPFVLSEFRVAYFRTGVSFLVLGFISQLAAIFVDQKILVSMTPSFLGNFLISIGSICALIIVVAERPAGLANSCLSESSPKWQLCYSLAKQRCWGLFAISLIAVGLITTMIQKELPREFPGRILFLLALFFIFGMLLCKRLALRFYLQVIKVFFNENGDDGQLRWALQVGFDKSVLFREGLLKSFRDRKSLPIWKFIFLWKGALLKQITSFKNEEKIDEST